VETIHGDRHQRDRESALSRFKKGEANILVATDVIGRGIDIKNVKTIINFDLPVKVTEYNNRIGRTARIGHTGRAISFYDPVCDSAIARRLCKGI
jgi:superfamily II DNA/RNA helicase